MSELQSNTTKKLWENPEYRAHMIAAHRGKPSNNRGGYKLPEEFRAKARNRVGELAANWRGGVSPVIALIRSSFKYAKWRDAVLTRDNYTCQYCWIGGGDLEVHHINPFIYIVKSNEISSLKQAGKCNELWDMNNGITLCKICHNKTKKGISTK